MIQPNLLELEHEKYRRMIHEAQNRIQYVQNLSDSELDRLLTEKMTSSNRLKPVVS